MAIGRVNLPSSLHTGGKRGGKRKRASVDTSSHLIAKELLDEVACWPNLTTSQRCALEAEIGSMKRRYLSVPELKVLAQFSYRQLARLKKGTLMLRDKEIVEAFMLLKDAPQES